MSKHGKLDCKMFVTHANIPADTEVRLVLGDDALEIKISRMIGYGAGPTLNYSQITHVSFDDEPRSVDTASGVARAIVGGALAGGVGAIVGAQTAGKKKKKGVYLDIFYTPSGDRTRASGDNEPEHIVFRHDPGMFVKGHFEKFVKTISKLCDKPFNDGSVPTQL